MGLAVSSFEAHFTPCVEVGWRLAVHYWSSEPLWATPARTTASPRLYEARLWMFTLEVSDGKVLELTDYGLDLAAVVTNLRLAGIPASTQAGERHSPLVLPRHFSAEAIHAVGDRVIRDHDAHVAKRFRMACTKWRATKPGSVSAATTTRQRLASIRQWWTMMGRRSYRDATDLYITADAGGSNGDRPRAWEDGFARTNVRANI